MITYHPMTKSSTTSPRSSPLLQQLFLSASNAKCGGGSGGSAAAAAVISPSPPPPSTSSSPATASGKGGGACGETDSTASSTIIRSLSKCFDAGVTMNDAVLHEDDAEVHRSKGGNAATNNAIIENDNGGQQQKQQQANGVRQHHQQWGPRHSFSSEDDMLSRNLKKTNNFGGSFSNFFFKPVGGGGGGVSSNKSTTCDNNTTTTPSKASSSRTYIYSSSTTSNKTAVPTTSTSSGDRHYHSQLALKTGMASAPTTPGSTHLASAVTPSSTTAAVRGGGGGGGSTSTTANNFWNIQALPATSCRSGGGADGMTSPSSATSLHSSSTPLSSSAKAAAEAVFGMISNAENFIATSTVVSLASGGGLCSPRNSPNSNSSLAAMEGIPEGDEQVENDIVSCVNDNMCFEFEEFGFNPFVENDQQAGGHSRGKNGSGAATTAATWTNYSEKAAPRSSAPTILQEQQQPQQEKPNGYEIRLKSSFSQLKAINEMQIASPVPLAPMQLFGRTHPNNNAKQPELQQQEQQQQQNDTNDEVSQSISSRALPDGLPFSELSVPTEIERSVSELTMRSHGAFERHRSDSRRMAYYAVGRTTNNINDKTLGNRRCYFSGKAITYSIPFYAGSVQQGPHTLVVFCLPSALDLPLFNDPAALAVGLGTFWNNKPDREAYLASLPAADENLLLEMRKRFPVSFDSLPVQVRSPHCWRLFVKFCFFSGLPIAEGETHYRVKRSVAVFPASTKDKQEEIALSHDVMEAVNGEVSAEILRLPNQKVFDYLRRQYSQQSSKLNDEVFARKNWELVMPEI
ncbi:hypothetical protein ACHAXH_002330 [Discostella pseudostelligera]